MSDQTPQTTTRTEDQTAQRITRTEGMSGRWVTLQRAVAIAMLVILAAPMVLIAQQIIPPLIVAGVLFAVALGLTWLRPRTGAIVVGVLAGLWLLLQLANFSLVISDLTQPSAMVSFLITLGMLVFGIAGVVGLAGVLRRMSGRIATRTLQASGAAMLGGLLLGLLASLV